VVRGSCVFLRAPLAPPHARGGEGGRRHTRWGLEPGYTRSGNQNGFKPGGPGFIRMASDGLDDKHFPELKY
jgi:hypothetical protein